MVADAFVLHLGPGSDNPFAIVQNSVMDAVADAATCDEADKAALREWLKDTHVKEMQLGKRKLGAYVLALRAGFNCNTNATPTGQALPPTRACAGTSVSGIPTWNLASCKRCKRARTSGRHLWLLCFTTR